MPSGKWTSTCAPGSAWPVTVTRPVSACAVTASIVGASVAGGR
ncbi:Uncharacterised protein [Bordetella pertussis]|nr:Uncharacterised protein [Bordetella pertussis]